MSTSYNHNRPPHDPENFNYIESVKLAINWHVNDILKARSGHSDVSEERIVEMEEKLSELLKELDALIGKRGTASSRTSVSSQPHLKTLPYLTRFPSDASMSSSSTRPVSGASFNSDGVDILSQKHDQDREDAAVEIQDDDGEIPLALAYHASLNSPSSSMKTECADDTPSPSKTNMQPEAQWPEKCKGKVPSPIIDTEVIIDLVSPIKPTSTLLPSSSSSFHPSPLTETSHKETSRTAVSERSRSTSPIKPSKLRCFGKRPWHRVSPSSTSDNDECEAVGSLFENRLPDAVLGRRDLIEKRLELSKSRAPFQARNDDAMVDLVSPIKLASATLASSSSSFNPSPLPKSSHKEPSHAFDVQSGRSSSPILRSSSKRPWHGISPSIPSDDDDSEGDAMILDKKWPYAVMGRRHSMEKGRRPVLPAVGTTASVVSLNSMRRDTRSESFEKDVKQSVDKQNLRPHDSPPSLSRPDRFKASTVSPAAKEHSTCTGLDVSMTQKQRTASPVVSNRLSLGSSEKPKELSRTSPHRAPTQTRYSMGSSSHCEAPKSVHGIAQWGNEPKKRKHVETESESEDEEGELKCAEPFVWPKKRENRAAQVVNDEGIRAGLSDAQEWGGDDVSIHPSPNLGDEAALTVGKEPDSDVFNQLSHDKERRFAHSRAKDGVEGKHDEEEMGSGKLVNAAHGNGEVFADLSLAGNNLFENDGEKLDPSNFVGLSADVSSSGVHVDILNEEIEEEVVFPRLSATGDAGNSDSAQPLADRDKGHTALNLKPLVPENDRCITADTNQKDEEVFADLSFDREAIKMDLDDEFDDAVSIELSASVPNSKGRREGERLRDGTGIAVDSSPAQSLMEWSDVEEEGLHPDGMQVVNGEEEKEVVENYSEVDLDLSDGTSDEDWVMRDKEAPIVAHRPVQGQEEVVDQSRRGRDGVSVVHSADQYEEASADQSCKRRDKVAIDQICEAAPRHDRIDVKTGLRNAGGARGALVEPVVVMSDTDEDLPLRFLNARLPSEEVVDDEGDEIPLLRNRKESKRLLTTAVAGALTPKRDREVKRKKMNRRTSSVPEGGGTGNRNSVAGDKFENAANEVFEVNVTIKEARSRREDPRRAGGGAVDRKDAALDDVEGAVHEANEISMRMRGRRSDPTLVSGEVTGSNTVAVGVEYLEISQKFTRSETSLTKTSPMRAIEAISTMKAAFEDSSASTRSVSPVGAGSAITRSEPLSIRISPSPDIQTATRSPVFKSVTSTAKGRSPARIGRNQASNQNEADDDVMIISSLPSSPSQNESISRPYHSAARMMMFDVDANEVVPVQPLRRRMTRKDSLNLHSIQTSPISLEREDSVDALPTQSVCASPRRTATVEPAAVQPPNEAAGEASVGYVDGPEDPASPVGGEAQRGGIARFMTCEVRSIGGWSTSSEGGTHMMRSDRPLAIPGRKRKFSGRSGPVVGERKMSHSELVWTDGELTNGRKRRIEETADSTSPSIDPPVATNNVLSTSSTIPLTIPAKEKPTISHTSTLLPKPAKSNPMFQPPPSLKPPAGNLAARSLYIQPSSPDKRRKSNPMSQPPPLKPPAGKLAARSLYIQPPSPDKRRKSDPTPTSPLKRGRIVFPASRSTYSFGKPKQKTVGLESLESFLNELPIAEESLGLSSNSKSAAKVLAPVTQSSVSSRATGTSGTKSSKLSFNQEICGACIKLRRAIAFPCGHNYCSPCIVQLFLAAKRDRALVPVRCCGDEIGRDIVTAFSQSEGALQLYDRFKERPFRFLEEDGEKVDIRTWPIDLRVCPGCGEGVIRDGEGCNDVTCYCGRRFCWMCLGKGCRCEVFPEREVRVLQGVLLNEKVGEWERIRAEVLLLKSKLGRGHECNWEVGSAESRRCWVCREIREGLLTCVGCKEERCRRCVLNR